LIYRLRRAAPGGLQCHAIRPLFLKERVMDALRHHDPAEPEFRVEETDRRTKIGRILMVAIVAIVVAVAWLTSGN
jgi:hypothetical protein